MSTAYRNGDMATLRAAIFAELYLSYSGMLPYQFYHPDDVELALVAGDVSNPLASCGDFAVPHPSIAGRSMPRAEDGFGRLFPRAMTALLSCLRTHPSHIMSVAEEYATAPLTPAFASDFGLKVENSGSATAIRASNTTSPDAASLSYAIPRLSERGSATSSRTRSSPP